MGLVNVFILVIVGLFFVQLSSATATSYHPVHHRGNHINTSTSRSDFKYNHDKSFVLTGYQHTAYRSSDCDVSFQNAAHTFQVTLLNWIGLYWTFHGLNNEWMDIVVEGETRGWVGMGFTSSSVKYEGAEVVIGWTEMKEAKPGIPAHSVAQLGSYLLGKKKWDLPIPNPVITLHNVSTCQTRGGRTVILFTRHVNAGKHIIEPWVGSTGYTLLAIGEQDKLGNVVEDAIFGMPVWQGRIGPEEPEGWDHRWLLHYFLIIMNVYAYLLH